MHAIVHAADVQDRDGGALLMASLFGAFPFLIKLYADGGYQRPEFQSAVKRILARVNVEIVKLSDQATVFVALPKLCIFERTFAWLGRCLRLAKDWECLNHKALAFLLLASIHLIAKCLPLDALHNLTYPALGTVISSDSPGSPIGYEHSAPVSGGAPSNAASRWRSYSCHASRLKAIVLRSTFSHFLSRAG